MGRGCADVGQTGSEVDTLGEGHEFEGDETLVVVKGQDTVELVELAAAEEAVGGIGAVGKHAFALHLVNDGLDDGLVLIADNAVVARVGVESQDGNLGHGDTEIALQRLVHKHNLVEKEVVGDGTGHILEGKVVGDDTDADAVADHYHKAAAPELVGEILSMAGEIEVRGLDVFLADGSGDEDVDVAFLQVFASTREGEAGLLASHLGQFADLDFNLLVSEVDDIEFAVDGFAGIVDAVERHVLVHGKEFLVVRSHLGGAIEDGGANVVHAAVAEGL